MKLTKFGFAALALALFSLPVIADISNKAAGLSHDLEEAATALHDYMHDNYGSSYGAHGMELTSAIAHDTIHDYGNGDASEDDVEDAVDDANDAFDSMRDQFKDAKILKNDKGAKSLFKSVRKLLKKVNQNTD